MANPQQQEDDEDDIDPTKILLPEEVDDENGLSMLQDGIEKKQMQQHYIRSIESTLVIRQLPSQGLSFQLWPAATTLVTLLDQHRCHPTTGSLSRTLAAISNGPDHRPLKVLELGSGTGLVGIAAAVTLGANVTVTDLPHVLPNLQFNVDANANLVALQGGTITVAPLRWGKDGDVETIERDFELVLASDVVYHDHLFEPLLQTLRLLMDGDKKMVFVMAHLRRWKKESVFFKRAKKLFNVEVIHVDSPCEGSRLGVVVYRFAGKSLKLHGGSADNLS